ncbi:hypothetical protein AAW14_06400 [Streptomyces hygroscopicus]|uniref:hypothetical protein n=1 Tax=Streptomyces hygroscopicus TaxID=1912 RepID=UPI00223FCA94|nr:hypothetical protein [Streptomyces hygroscopicus]MCW7941670.1 hypothetical protein [Streptomyces hygroscopicus]
MSGVYERGGHASGDVTVNELAPPPELFVQRPTALEGKVVEVPVEARIAAKALRTASDWLPDEYRDMLREAADDAERDWDGGCCPVCQETWCDGGCPLEEVRAKILKGQR